MRDEKKGLTRQILTFSLLVLALSSWPAYTQNVKKRQESQKSTNSTPTSGWWDVALPYQKRFRKGNPNRPAVLLFHGLHQRLENWTKPSQSVGYNYDYSHTPNGSSTTVTTAPAYSVTAPVMTTFNVSRHGFHFANGFTGDILIDVPGIGQVNLGRTSYGLCGGMAFAAYDNYLRDAAAPLDTTPFASGTANRSYVYSRQDDSFRYDNAFMIRRFIEWMPLPIKTTLGVTGLQVRSHRQFKRRIKPALEAGTPVVLGILKADINDVAQRGQKNALFINHQVLAIGFEPHAIPGEDEWDIHIYDPNFPDQIQTLHTGRRIQTRRSYSQKTGGFRGFFVIPYRSKRPPWAPANLQQRNAQMIQALVDDDAPETEEERKELRLPPPVPVKKP